MVNVAVIGVGSMGQNHARVFFGLEDVDLRAVVDPNADQAEKVAMKYNARFYTSYQEMFEKEDIDAVSIAVPTKFHKECALYAIGLGKHVLLEKPIAQDEFEAKEIIDCAKEKNVKLMIGHIERFNPAIVELKKRLESDELGEIYKIDVQRIGPFPSRISDVGVIIDLSVHDIDIIQYLMNSRVKRIYAETQQRLHSNCEDSVTALLTYENGVLGILNVNYLSPTKIRQISIFGKKGMFRVNYLTQELYFYENKSFGSDDWSSVSEGDMHKITVQRKEPLHLELRHFIDAVNDHVKLIATGEDGLYALKTAQSLITSAKEKRIVEF